MTRKYCVGCHHPSEHWDCEILVDVAVDPDPRMERIEAILKGDRHAVHNGAQVSYCQPEKSP